MLYNSPDLFTTILPIRDGVAVAVKTVPVETEGGAARKSVVGRRLTVTVEVELLELKPDCEKVAE